MLDTPNQIAVTNPAWDTASAVEQESGEIDRLLIRRSATGEKNLKANTRTMTVKNLIPIKTRKGQNLWAKHLLTMEKLVR